MTTRTGPVEKNSRSILAVLPSSKRWWRYDRNLTRRSRGIILDAWDPIVRPHAAFSYLLAVAKAQRLHPDFPSTALSRAALSHVGLEIRGRSLDPNPGHYTFTFCRSQYLQTTKVQMPPSLGTLQVCKPGASTHYFSLLLRTQGITLGDYQPSIQPKLPAAGEQKDNTTSTNRVTGGVKGPRQKDEPHPI